MREGASSCSRSQPSRRQASGRTRGAVDMRALIMAGMALMLTAAGDADKASAKLSKYSEADYASKMVVLDGDLETTAIISTLKGPHLKTDIGGGKGFAWMRAGINKKTGLTVYQLTASADYWGDWRFYSSINYSTPNGIASAELHINSRSVLACFSACDHVEEVALTVDESLLRSIASDSSKPWRFKFIGGNPWEAAMSPVEVKAILTAVAGYKATHKI